MNKFNAGDSVRVVHDHSTWMSDGYLNLPHDAILTAVSGEYPDLSDYEIWVSHLNEWPDDFELVSSITQEDIVRDESDVVLGVYRPNLEDRKVGKIPMHMVVDGFPNALKAVAEVMGWAADVKGYKLHDWRNLPNADVEFPAAEARHANENSIQKVSGLQALDRTDHESKKLHVAHKVFNALAELELILCGKIE